MSHFASRRLAGIALAAILAAGPAALAQPTGPGYQPPAVPAAPATGGAVDPNQVVDVDFSTGIFLEPLPFDVPFTLRGSNPAPGVVTITGRISQFPKFVNCGNPGEPPRRVQLLGPASLVTQGGQLKFLLPVDELEVNRYYCFELTQKSRLSPDDLNVFHAKAAAAVDAALQRVKQDTPQAQTIQALEELRAKLRAAVNDLLGPNQNLNPPPDSILAPGPAATLKLRNSEQFTRILQSQIQRRDALNLLRTRQPAAVEALARLVQSDEYHRLVSSVLSGRSSSVSLDEFLKAKPGALSLAGLTRDDLEFVAFGMDRGSPVVLDQVYAGADAQAMATRLAATVGALVELENPDPRDPGLVDALNQNQVLRAAAGLDDDAGRAALGKLPDLVIAARRALQADLFAVQQLAAVLAERETLIQSLTSQLDPLLQEVQRVQATTVSGFQVRGTLYIGADIGIGTASRINEVFGYVGANIYMRPVNKAAHLRWSTFFSREHFWRELGKRFAFMIGLPYNDINKPGERSGLVASRPLIVGAGLRINDLLRLSGGALIFKKNDPNPLINRQRIGSTPFVSLSVDWDLKSSFLKIFNAATGNPASP